MRIALLSLLVLLAVICPRANGVIFHAVDSIRIQDSGGTGFWNDPNAGNGNPGEVITLLRDNGVIQSNKVVVEGVSGDLDLLSFQVGGVDYFTSEFASGVGTNTLISSDQLENVLQPGQYSGPLDGNFAYGTTAGGLIPGVDLDNGAVYLTQGARGLSFSSVLNYQNGDPRSILTIPLSFLADPASSTTRATFIAGDGANNQRDDLWEFLDANNNVIASVLVQDLDTTWHQFGRQELDRIVTSTGAIDADDTVLDVGLMAFSLEAGDFTGGTWEQVTQLRLSLPADSNSTPRTDYAFFGIDLDIVRSPLAVVPEPSRIAFLFVAAVLLGGVRHRRTKS